MLENAGDQVVINFNFVSDYKLSFFFGRQLKFRCSSYFWIVLCGYLFPHDDVLQFMDDVPFIQQFAKFTFHRTSPSWRESELISAWHAEKDGWTTWLQL